HGSRMDPHALASDPTLAATGDASDSSAHADSPAFERALASAALPAPRGRRFWKSLDELAGSETFEDFLRREYPSQVHKLADLPERREFLKLMGASLALAGVASCTRQPTEKIVPYARMPESAITGKPRWFA